MVIRQHPHIVSGQSKLSLWSLDCALMACQIGLAVTRPHTGGPRPFGSGLWSPDCTLRVPQICLAIFHGCDWLVWGCPPLALFPNLELLSCPIHLSNLTWLCLVLGAPLIGSRNGRPNLLQGKFFRSLARLEIGLTIPTNIAAIRFSLNISCDPQPCSQ